MKSFLPNTNPERCSLLLTSGRLLGGLLLFALTLLFTQSALAAVAFRAAASASAASNITQVGTGTAANASSGNVKPTLPAGIQTNDLLLCLVESHDTEAHSITTEWTTLYSLTGTAHHASLFYKIATASESNPTITHSGGNSIIARCVAFRGIDTTTPFDVAYAAQGSASDLTVETGSMTTVSSGDLILFPAHIANNPGSLSVTTAGGLTWTQSFYSATSSGLDSAIGLFYANQPAPSTLGPLQATASDQAGESHGALLALRSTSSLTINKPTGTTAYDVMIASIATTPSTILTSAPTGWTLIRQVTQSNATSSVLSTFYKIADAHEPTNYTWTFSSGAQAGPIGGIASFSGVDTTRPIDVETGNATASALTHVAPSITTTLANDMLVTILEFASASTWTPPGGMTEAIDLASQATPNANGISMELNYEARPVVGATGTRSANADANADAGATQSIALKASLLTCFTDEFNRADGAPAGNWVVAHESGTFGNPTISSQRLRLTNASSSVSTMAALQQLFPAAGNKIVVEFDHFAYDGSGADGMCVVLSDASVAPVPGAFGGSLGYAPKQASAGGDTTHAGFAGGWLGVALDEFGNFSNPTEGRTGGPGLQLDSAAIRGSGSLYTGYAYLAGTATLAPGIDNNGTANPPHRYRITIDHTNGINAYTSVERDTGTGFATLVSSFDAKATAGQAAVPANWYLSFTGSTGASTNIHEIDNLRVCSTQPQPLPTLDHIRILHDGSANTCVPETITLQTCADAPCTTLYLGTVTGTLPNIGTWAPSSSFSISGGQTTVTLAASGSVTLGGTATSPTATNVTTCYNTTTGTNDCTLNFASASLSFDVPDHTSATRQLVTITDCTAQLTNKTRNVKFWSTYLNPSTGTKQGSVVTGTGNADCATGYSALGTTYTGATTLSLAFGTGSSPKATFSLCYPDAGNIQLNALYEGANTNTPPDAGVVLLGNDPFVAKPALFALSNIKQTASPQLPNPAAIDASGNKFVKAGEAFTATVTAQNAKAQTTPNFSKETSPEGIRLTATLFAPVGGANSTLTCKGSTTECVVPGGSLNFTNGATTITDLAWGEVGIITIAPIIGDRDYLGAGDITGTASGKVGRFIPDHFTITPGSVTEGCSGNFTYFGQDGFSTAFTLTAQNQAGTTTQNYTGAFAKLNLATWNNYNFTAGLPTGSILAASTTTTPTGSWSNGVASVNAKHIASRPATPVTPADITISAKPTDTDLITAASAVAVHAATTPLRFGRLVLQNAYGPETDDHKLPFQTQYLDNTTQWVTNAEDNCTTLTAANFSFGNYQQQLTSAEMNSNHINVSLSTLTTNMGKGSLYLTKPSGWDYKYLGSVDVTALIGTSLPWLRYEWVGAIDYNDDPTGRVNFGIYRGNDRIINWREIIR